MDPSATGAGTGGTAIAAASQKYGMACRRCRYHRRNVCRPIACITGSTGFSGDLLHP